MHSSFIDLDWLILTLSLALKAKPKLLICMYFLMPWDQCSPLVSVDHEIIFWLGNRALTKTCRTNRARTHTGPPSRLYRLIAGRHIPGLFDNAPAIKLIRKKTAAVTLSLAFTRTYTANAQESEPYTTFLGSPFLGKPALFPNVSSTFLWIFTTDGRSR